MTCIDLQGFELTDAEVGQEPAPAAGWLPAAVPGGVHEALLAADRIEHPFFGDNEHAVRWIEGRTWWYRTSFAADPPAADERVTLSFAALDTVCEIWLNGTRIHAQANQHLPVDVDVTSLLQPTNELRLRFDPPLRGLLSESEAASEAAHARDMRERVRPGAPELEVDELLLPALRSRRRKATFSWGWDFAPRVPSIGITGPVRLVRARTAVVAGIGVRTAKLDVEAKTATIEVDVELDCFAGRPDRLRITALDQVIEVDAAADVMTVPIELAHVRPWWTHDLGDQPLYTLSVELLRGDDVLDRRAMRFGVRTVELDRSVDEEEDGRHFRFLLNGRPVFARGANWVPASSLVGSVTDDRYRDLVALARQGEMNMIRMWGGGIYEPDAFYDACDEQGVLVWQDFMFACFDYPSDDPRLTEEVQLEAAAQVRRLRNHACLALWCGNNEVQLIHEMTQGSAEPGPWGWSFFHELLPGVVAQHAPGALYWPGSPWGDAEGEGTNGVADGDRHAWEVWHGLDLGAGGPTEFASRGEAVHFSRYSYDHGRFISEFGIHASPQLGTLERWTPAGSLDLRSPAFDQRNKDTPKDKGWALMEHETGAPTTLAEYVDFSMACQAEGLKHGVEHYRRRQPHCSGTLVWQLNDVWPGFSWSVIDHDLVPKAGFYFLQRAYRPVLASFRAGADGLGLWLTNSTAAPVEVDLLVQIGSFAGAVGREHKVAARIAAGGSEPVWTQRGLPPRDELAWVSSADGAVEPNRMFFAPLRDLPVLQGGLPETQVTRTGPSTASVELLARHYTYFAHVMSDDSAVRFDANYLDLRPDEPRSIAVSGLRDGSRLSVSAYGAAPLPLHLPST